MIQDGRWDQGVSSRNAKVTQSPARLMRNLQPSHKLAAVERLTLEASPAESAN
jgi:hypothetical protein